MNKTYVLFLACFSVFTCLFFSGCDSDDDPDHNPPPGQGAIFIENGTSEDIRVYINGINAGEVQDYNDRAFDLNPGLYRIVLDEEGGDRTYRDDIDVLVGRLSVIDVSGDAFDSDDYDVEVFFRTP